MLTSAFFRVRPEYLRRSQKPDFIRVFNCGRSDAASISVRSQGETDGKDPEEKGKKKINSTNHLLEGG